MAAKEDLHDQPGNSEILCNILRINPTSGLDDKSIGARELKALAKKNSTKVADAGAIPHLVALLSAGAPSVIQVDVVGALGYIALDNSVNQGKVAAAGAIPPMVALLSASTPASVLEATASALANIVAMNPDNQDKVASAGAIPAFVALLCATTEPIMLERVACALNNLVANNPENQGKAAYAGAIPPLVVLLSSSTPANVQDKAALALGSLVAINPENQGKAASAGAIPPLVALLSPSTPAHVKQRAAYALAHLVINNPDNQVKVASANGIPSLVAFLSILCQARVKEAVVITLRHLATCSSHTRKIMAAADVFTPLVGLMTDSRTTIPVFSTAPLIVEVLLSDPLVCAMGTSVTPFLPLMALLQANTSDHVLHGTASVLRTIAYASPSVRKELAAAGIIPRLMAVRAARSYPPQVQKQLDILHVLLRDLCSCRDCVSYRKRVNGQTSHTGSSTSVLERPVATTSPAKPVDSDKLMQELLEEEEREKAMKEAKAKAKKEKKQRQKGKKKGKSKEEQLAADLMSEGGGKDADKHLMHQQPVGEGGAGGSGGCNGGMEPSGGDDDDDELLCVVCMERERDVFLQPCGHVILCSRCCDEVLAKSSKCPVCRAQVLEHALIEYLINAVRTLNCDEKAAGIQVSGTGLYKIGSTV
eukprot:gene20819-biopygen29554